ncbi:AraC family transcriptional regulator [Haloferula sp. BvORR071]|uniref:AraC family transcriptional regulator n=1 Tax=Haloferula sp. BvORR071 TaxID=1396141 RepID=UPI0006981790|nr:AraC family transcriptional regulator [Haloferula sp. BvORR071]
MNDRFRISTLLAGRLAEHGLVPAAILRLAGLPAAFFQQEKIYATTAELFALWRAVGELSADPAIGLQLGNEPRMERYHPAAVAAVCSRSYHDALQRMARYKQLTCPEEVRISVARDEAMVEFIYHEATDDEPEVLIDMALAWILSVGRRGTNGQIIPLRLELKRPARHRELLESHFGCRVKFKAGRNALLFRKADLARPFVTYNEELLALIGAQLETELEAERSTANLGEQVKRTLKRSLAGKRPTLQEVARELGMSTRTLQRKLGEAGITFQHLVEDTRRELAHHYLKHSSVELNETAFLLGYEDANSFFRAFQRWEDTSPGEWRTRHQLAVGRS